MIPGILQTSLDTLCDRLDALRELSFINCGRSYVSERMVNRYVQAHRMGDEQAGGALLCHVEEMLRWARYAGYQTFDAVFLAEVALDEAIAAERAILKAN